MIQYLQMIWVGGKRYSVLPVTGCTKVLPTRYKLLGMDGKDNFRLVKNTKDTLFALRERDNHVEIWSFTDRNGILEVLVE